MYLTEDYVSFEIAKLLKEKGFDGECQGYYEVPTKLSSQKDVRKQLNVLPKNWNEYNKECVVCEYISISTHQMALKWLRKVHNIIIITHPVITDDDGECGCLWGYTIRKRLDSIHQNDDVYYNPEDATEAAILYVSKNLI